MTVSLSLHKNYVDLGIGGDQSMVDVFEEPLVWMNLLCLQFVSLQYAYTLLYLVLQQLLIEEDEGRVEGILSQGLSPFVGLRVLHYVFHEGVCFPHVQVFGDVVVLSVHIPQYFTIASLSGEVLTFLIHSSASCLPFAQCHGKTALSLVLLRSFGASSVVLLRGPT